MVTYDDATGLDWLDLTETQGISYNAALATSFVEVDGFRHATSGEVNTLFLNAGFLTTNNVNDPANNPAAAFLLSSMGCTQDCGTNFDQGKGFADSNATYTVRPNYHEGPLGAGAAVVSLFSSNKDLVDPNSGHYLVRDHVDSGPGPQVPEPSAALLFFVGTVVVGGAVRKKKVA